MKLQLKDIASIQTGLFAKPSGEGDLVYLQARHFDENGQLLITPHPDLRAEGVAEKHLLRKGDLLFAAKGFKNFAAVFENHNAPAVASTSFFVIRITVNNILPEFLAWTLNSQPLQTVLKGQARGTSIPSISKQVLESLEIFIPPVDIQQMILQITKLRLREKELKNNIEALREQQIQQKIFTALKK